MILSGGVLDDGPDSIFLRLQMNCDHVTINKKSINKFFLILFAKLLLSLGPIWVLDEYSCHSQKNCN